MVYMNYANDEYQIQKFEGNKVRRERLMKKYRVINGLTDNPDDYDIIYTEESGYHSRRVQLHKFPGNILDDELALIFDDFYLLLFGYSKDNMCHYTIFTD